MTVRVDKEMRERIDAKKIDINKKNYIYESPDNGTTIYRREIYDDVSGVKLDKNPDQLEFEFPDQHTADLKRTKKIESIFDKLNVLEAQVREIRKSLIELG
jgi:hypothetical protein